jgi:hypothetical protein
MVWYVRETKKSFSNEKAAAKRYVLQQPFFTVE